MAAVRFRSDHQVFQLISAPDTSISEYEQSARLYTPKRWYYKNWPLTEKQLRQLDNFKDMDAYNLLHIYEWWSHGVLAGYVWTDGPIVCPTIQGIDQFAKEIL